MIRWSRLRKKEEAEKKHMLKKLITALTPVWATTFNDKYKAGD